MVLRLPVDVIDDDLTLRLTDAEGAVPLLPLKPRLQLVQPTRRVALQLLHDFGQSQGRR